MESFVCDTVEQCWRRLTRYALRKFVTFCATNVITCIKWKAESGSYGTVSTFIIKAVPERGRLYAADATNPLCVPKASSHPIAKFLHTRTIYRARQVPACIVGFEVEETSQGLMACSRTTSERGSGNGMLPRHYDETSKKEPKHCT